MTLTEQWKKGELEEGFYYFKIPDGAIEIASEYRLIRYNLTKDADKIEVLAPVPSYEELEELKIDNHNLKAWIKHFQPKYKKMEKENQQLKKLLCKCKFELMGHYTEDWSLMIEIDNAIGEK